VTKIISQKIRKTIWIKKIKNKILNKNKINFKKKTIQKLIMLKVQEVNNNLYQFKKAEN